MQNDLYIPVTVTRSGRHFEPAKISPGVAPSALPGLLAAAAIALSPASQALAAKLADRAIAKAHAAAESLLAQLGLEPHSFD